MTSAAPTIVPLPEVRDTHTGSGGEGWIVTVFNNETNTWDQVVDILMVATGCTLEEAEIETWEIDRLGRSVVHHGDEDCCQDAADIIATIGIRVEVSQG